MNEISGKVLPYEARAEQNFVENFSFVLGAMEFQEKLLLRFTDL